MDVLDVGSIPRVEQVKITAALGIGPGQAKVSTCDFSYKYVEINAEYHT